MTQPVSPPGGAAGPGRATGPAGGRQPGIAVAVAVACGSGLLWLLACALPALRFRVSPGGHLATWTGSMALASGWLGPLTLVFAWYANIQLAAALILVLFRKWAVVVPVAVAGLVVALDTITLCWIDVPNGDAPETLRLTGLLPGFFVWLASFGLVLAGGLMGRLAGRQAAAAARASAAGALGQTGEYSPS